jgi:hypothetical protein
MTSQRFCINRSDPRASPASSRCMWPLRHRGSVEWFDTPKVARTSLGARKIREFEVVVRGTCENCMKENSHVW